MLDHSPGVNQGLTIKLGNLAQRYLKVGRNEEAQAAVTEALQQAAITFSADDWKVGNLHTIAASFAIARGDAGAAVSQANAALAIYDKASARPSAVREGVGDSAGGGYAARVYER